MSKVIQIDPLSTVSLFVQPLANGKVLSSATGFLVSHDGNDYLLTNWHVVAGRNSENNAILSETGQTPDSLRVWYHSSQRLGIWKSRDEKLYRNKGASHIWIEHPRGREVDVVALAVARDDSLSFYPLDLSLADADILLSPSDEVSIIGFPLGQAVDGNLPIWKTGHIASDLDIDRHGKPVFLIDATTKSGMSGAPVIARRIGIVRTSKGFSMGKSAERFLGVYSGRTSSQSDIGMVWKPQVVHEIL